MGEILFEEMGGGGGTFRASTAVITHSLCRFCYPSEINTKSKTCTPIPAAAPSKASVWGHSLAGIAGSSDAGSMDVCLL